MGVLRRPTRELLPDYSDALQRGWSPDNIRPETALKQLAAIENDPDAFIASLEDREAKGPPVKLPDGSTINRLPSFRRWIWKDGFAGTVGLRWQPGTDDLPPMIHGHIGYAVVPWRRREGLATEGLREMLSEARAVGLTRVDLTTDQENTASIGVIEKLGGVRVTHAERPAAAGEGSELLYRIRILNQ